ncbi:MAG TPA: class I SAM-dependent methyltransferase [Bryobacteraceae bacterium]|jgi:2-polyprenyl-3-methyl-5-hydroxy-6-metoxy-1,4-benzoquinol methylase
MSEDTRAAREIRHGQWLAEQETETVWGWGTPAGQLRAKRRADLIMDGSGLNEKSRVLEIGCGTGFFTERFAATGATIFAVDISPELLVKARSRNLPDRVTFIEKRFEECDAEGPFDAIIGSSILHHLDIDKSIERIKELLKRGGSIGFAEPNMLNPQVYLERRFHYLPMFSYTSPDETAFVRWKLADKLRRAGFEHIAITPFDWLHPATPKSLIGLVKGMGKVVEALPIAREFAGSLYINARLPR